LQIKKAANEWNFLMINKRIVLPALSFCLGCMLADPAAASNTAGKSPVGTRIDLDDFLIDATEVTIGQFADYSAKQNVKTSAEREGGGFEYGLGWERRPGWTYKTPYGNHARNDEPAVHLNWFEAKAYCEDAGGSLPTQAQWKQAAYTEKRKSPPRPFEYNRTYPYPTGETPAGANTVGTADGWERHAPVAHTPAGVNGLYDMGANVWEWLADARGNERLTAGGSWWYDPSKMRAEGMQLKPADFYALYIGFRCIYKK
jgi:sulfatase modifying factor 1